MLAVQYWGMWYLGHVFKHVEHHQWYVKTMAYATEKIHRGLVVFPDPIIISGLGSPEFMEIIPPPVVTAVGAFQPQAV
jgi:hypothetical protein